MKGIWKNFRNFSIMNIMARGGINFETANSIYSDYQATTPIDPRVIDKMQPFLLTKYANPSSSHLFGKNTMNYIEEARNNVASLMNADFRDIIFTSGATESNNIVIKGVARFARSRNSTKNHIITVKTEHKCILESCNKLIDEGFEVTFLPVNKNGLIDLNLFESSIKPSTCLVSVMAVNNEIGVIQPLKEIGKICRSKNIYFHSDAAQGFGKINIDVEDMNLDLVSISGHKIYGPKGIGGLFVRRNPRVLLEPIINGGGQERGIRSGTLSPVLIIGLGEASRIATIELENDRKHVEKLFNRLIQGLTSSLKHIYINGDLEKRWKGNLNICFAGVEGEGMMMRLKNICVSTGSACNSATLEISHVLKALNIPSELGHTSIRFGLGRFTTDDEIEYIIKSVIKVANSLREISPIWEDILNRKN